MPAGPSVSVVSSPEIIVDALVMDAEPDAARAQGPVGIGGWLWVPFVQLVTGGVREIYQALKDLIPLLANGSWESAVNRGSPFAWLIPLQLIVNSALTVGTVVVFTFAVQKRKEARAALIGWYVARFVWGVLLVGIMTEIGESRGKASNDVVLILESVVGTAIWVPYVLLSRRVKNTFVA